MPHFKSELEFLTDKLNMQICSLYLYISIPIQLFFLEILTIFGGEKRHISSYDKKKYSDSKPKYISQNDLFFLQDIHHGIHYLIWMNCFGITAGILIFLVTGLFQYEFHSFLTVNVSLFYSLLFSQTTSSSCFVERLREVLK